MFWKFAALAAVIAVAWFAMFRKPARIRKPAPQRTQQLVKCTSCGIYLPAGTVCYCADNG